MSVALTKTVRIVDTGSCCTCGTTICMEQPLYRKRLDDGRTFYCPNGHPQIFTKRKRLEDELAEERRRSTAMRDLLAAEERSHAATRGHLTRMKKRVACGVCPYCNRSFADSRLARHIATKHPEESK